ncbi:MAG: hypothetical protein DRI87_06670 [Bacteroidetes bacterium]|nr:MAG: hypothetical protein DRI87_06670 [Bacteroidota bacterium]
MVVYADGVEYAGSFTMTGLGSPLGGNVIFDMAPLASIVVLTLMRTVPLTQEKEYPVYGPFPAKSHENALDKLTWIAQQLQEQLNRTWKTPIDDPGEDPEYYIPTPEAGKVLAWAEDEKGLENQPGIGTFTALVVQANAAAVAAASSSDTAHDWAQEDVDVPVDDGVHPVGYSAYHWASLAAEGGIIELATSEPTMLTFSTPQARYRSIDPLINAPNAMVKLDADGLVPLDQMPINGALTYIAAYEGHNRCPKHDYGVPDSACAEPDTRNPTERFTSYVPESGHVFVVVACDEEPALNQINLLNPDTGLYEVQTVTNGDASIYADGTSGLPMGWYLYEGFANQTVLASGVVFDDTTTTIKGDELQTFNQNMDASVAGKLAKSGGIMTGELELANNVSLTGSDAAGTASYNIAHVDGSNVMNIGGGGLTKILDPMGTVCLSFALQTTTVNPDTYFYYGRVPSNSNEVANKEYVDTQISLIEPGDPGDPANSYIIDVTDYLTNTDGTVSQNSELQSAMTAATGGTLYFPTGVKAYITSNINIPVATRVLGEAKKDVDPYSSTSTIVCGPTASILMDRRSIMEKMMTVSKGIFDLSSSPATPESYFSGTGIILRDGDCVIRHSGIYGFTLGLGTNVGGSFAGRPTIVEVSMDNSNGIAVGESYGGGILVDVSCWPYCNEGGSGAALERSGDAINLTETQPYMQIQRAVTFGYLNGVVLDNVGHGLLIKDTYCGGRSDGIGISTTGTVSDLVIDNFSASSMRKAVLLEHAGGRTLTTVSNSMIFTTNVGIQVMTDVDLIAVNNHFASSSSANSAGIHLNRVESYAVCTGNYFEGNTGADYRAILAGSSPTGQRIYGPNMYKDTTSQGEGT